MPTSTNRTPRRSRSCRSPSRATKKPNSPSEEEREPAEVIGALIVEQMVDSRTPDGFLQRVDVVRTHSATALTNALEYEGLFLMPRVAVLGQGHKLFRGRTLPKTLAILGAIAAALAFLCFYPADFKLEGDGQLRAQDPAKRVGGNRWRCEGGERRARRSGQEGPSVGRAARASNWKRKLRRTQRRTAKRHART